MALTSDEKTLAQQLKSQGYSTEDIIAHIGAKRLNQSSSIDKERLTTFREKEAEQESNLFRRVVSDVPQDITQGFRGATEAVTQGIETAGEARQQVETGEISPVAGTVKTIGGGLGAGAKVVGEGLMSLLRLPFTQRAEEATGEVVEQGAETLAQTQPVQDIVARYESLDDEQKAIVDGVLGTTEGLATIVGAGPATKVVKQTLASASQAVKTGATRLGKVTDELKITGVSLPSTQGISQAIDLGFEPESIMQRVARVSKGKQTKFEQRAGESIGQYLVARNIFGTPDEIVDQLYRRMKDSKNRVDASIATVKGEFKAPAVKTALDDLIERDTRVSTEGAVSPDSKRIEQLYKKYNQQGLTLSEVNEVKRLYERNVRVDYLSVGAPSDKLVRATNIDSALRNLVEDKATKAGVTTVKELNKETSLARQLLDDLGAEYAGQAGNNAIGLTDTIFLAEALGNPVAAAGFIAKKTLSNKGVMSALAKRLSKNVGSKEALPDVPEDTSISAYLEFLAKQEAKKADQ